MNIEVHAIYCITRVSKVVAEEMVYINISDATAYSTERERAAKLLYRYRWFNITKYLFDQKCQRQTMTLTMPGWCMVWYGMVC